MTTVRWLDLGHREGNPLFAWILQFGLPVFVFAKVLMLAGPVLLLEVARKKSPHSAEAGTWIAFVAYLILWGSQIIRIRIMLGL